MAEATVACKHCGTPTRMLGTRECDRCHELYMRIRMDPDLASKMLEEIVQKDAQKKYAEPDWKSLLVAILDSADNTGCEDCYVVGGSVIEAARNAVEALK